MNHWILCVNSLAYKIEKAQMTYKCWRTSASYNTLGNFLRNVHQWRTRNQTNIPYVTNTFSKNERISYFNVPIAALLLKKKLKDCEK